MADNIVPLQIQEIDGLLLVDSRLIAERLGIQHESFLKTIRKHRERVESRFGHLRFEVGTVTNSVGAINEVTFVLLAESQASVLMTLSKNTDQVVECKLDLVDAFEKAKSIIKTVIPAQNNRIQELELEIQLRNAEAHSALAQQKLLDTRHYITTALPEPVQQKILGYTEVKTVEYRDRVIHNEDLVRDGSTVNKTALCKRLNFLTTKGKPDYKKLNNFLVACNLPDSAWQLTAAIQENLELTSAAADEVERRWFAAADRTRFIGE
jgi:phage regulator Rha-like protein